MSKSGERFGVLAPAQEVAERVLEASRSDGCMVVIKDAYEAEVRYANNTATTNGLRRDRRVTVVSVVGVAGGVASGVASRSGQVEVGDLAAASEADARTSPPAADAAPLVIGGGDAGFDDPPGVTSLEVLDEVLDALEDIFDRSRGREPANGRIRTTSSLDDVSRLEHRAASSPRPARGEGRARRPKHRQRPIGLGRPGHGGLLRCCPRRARGPRAPRPSVGGANSRVAGGPVRNRAATRRCGGSRRARRRRVPGRAAEDGRSVFSAPGGGTRIGQRLTTLPFTLESAPGLPGIECVPYVVAVTSGADQSLFDNGLPIGPTRWIDGGVLSKLRRHRADASRSGVAPTPPVDNLLLRATGASASVDDLVERVERGLLVTCLYYLHEVDPATLLFTGLTRDGVYLVEHGEVTGAVNNFRFNESPIDVLARSIDAGRSERALSREWSERLTLTTMPALRVADFNMSSVSPAN